MHIETNKLVVLLLSIVIFALSGNFCSAGQAPLLDIHCSGKVMDYEASPVDQADVYMYEIHREFGEGRTIYKQLGHTATDSQGDYAIDVQAVDCSNIVIVIYKPGLTLKYERSINIPGTHLELLTILEKPDVFSGTVLNQDKEPIANAKLQILLSDPRYPITSVPSLENVFIKTTDAQDRFSFPDFSERSSAYFLVEAPGKAGTWTFWEDSRNQITAGSEDIEFVLEDESRIHGRVIDEDTGQGVPGVILLAKPNKGMVYHYFPYRTISNQEGFFEISGLPADDYSVQVGSPYEEMPDWVGRDVKVTVEPGQTKQNIEIPVSKGSTIEITLVSQTGEPLESAQASVSQAANFGRNRCYNVTAYSDENGVATFRVPQGQCQVTGGGNVYQSFPDPDPINAVKGQVHRREIILVEKQTISGIVTDQNGEPVANVFVTIKPACKQSDITDAQGRFEVKWYMPLYSVKKRFLLARDFENNRAALVEIFEETRTQDITLQPAYTLSGQVTDPNGTGIQMAAADLGGRLPRWFINFGNKVLSDEQGKYEIKAIPALVPDLNLYLNFGAHGYGSPSGIEVLPEGDPNIPIENNVTLQPMDQTLSGIVVDANDEPVVGIEVRTGSGSSGSAINMSDFFSEPGISAVTDNQGRFFLEGVKRGPLIVQVSGGVARANGGDKDVKIITGQGLLGLLNILPRPLINKPLPDISEIGIELEDAENKSILLCFFDYQQRPSRNSILQLKEQFEELREKEVEVAVVQAATIDKETFDNWCEQQNLFFPIGVIETNIDQTKSKWGVQALPWLILTDTGHIVTAEGFSINELDEKIKN